MGGFNWTKAGKQQSTRRYGVEVDYDTERRRQLETEAAERQGQRTGPGKSRKKKKRHAPAAVVRGDRKSSGAVRPATVIICVACNAEVKHSEFERHRVERHGYTAGVYVSAPTNRVESGPQPVIRRGGGPRARVAPPQVARKAAFRLAAATTHGAP